MSWYCSFVTVQCLKAEEWNMQNYLGCHQWVRKSSKCQPYLFHVYKLFYQKSALQSQSINCLSICLQVLSLCGTGSVSGTVVDVVEAFTLMRGLVDTSLPVYIVRVNPCNHSYDTPRLLVSPISLLPSLSLFFILPPSHTLQSPFKATNTANRCG